ncbi:MAG: amidohydrolase family protein [Gemmatimonadaceae bacterium]
MLASPAVAAPPPIIDVHLHAHAYDEEGPPPVVLCAPYEQWPARDPAEPMDKYVERAFKKPDCARPLRSAPSDTLLRDRTLAALRRHNIVAVTSGHPDRVQEWWSHAPDRIIRAVQFGVSYWPSTDALRALHKQGRLQVLGEVITQYGGTAPDDPKLEPYYALAEELDIPVAIHMGLGPPGTSYFATPGYRMALSDPLRLEHVLLRHPKLRLYVMHAGWPLGDRMVGLLYSHPQVYVDVGVIDWVLPRAEFQAYLKRLIDAGFANRIMFGSDQMVWPDAIDAAIQSINQVPFLTAQQKRDIFYNNAARFFRLREGQSASSLAH